MPQIGWFSSVRLNVRKGYATVLATTAPAMPRRGKGEGVDVLETTAGGQTVTERKSPAEQSTVDGAREETYAASLLAVDFFATVALIPLLNADELGLGSSFSAGFRILGAIITAVLAVALLGMMRAYDPMNRLPGARLRTSGQLVLVSCATAVTAVVATGGFNERFGVGNVLVLVLALSTVWITARVAVSIVERRHPAPTLIVGTGDTARRVWELSARHRECAFEVLGFVDDEPLTLPPGAPPTVGHLADLPKLVAAMNVKKVIVAYTNIADSELLRIIRLLDGRARVQVVPRLYELVQARGFELGRMSVLDAGGLARGARERGLKRAFDFIVASLILLLVAPLLVVIGLVVKLDSPGPVLFRQRRVGKNCKIFDVLKFRTLTHGAEEHGHELIEGMPIASAVQELKSRSVEKHVTRTGGLLRSTSLDELPQLWNVIRGEMSLVGPRPLREYEVDSLDEWQVATRQTVLPGITGLWQVSGRSSVSWDERVHLDCAYARHWSLTSDLRILARTVAVVLRRSDTV
jgi:exopolysaccharide biosynthesis polyprenyl glycosylphosphotransferase